MKRNFIKALTRGGRLRRKIFFMMVVVGVLPIVAVGILALYSIDLFHRLDVASIEDTLLDQKIEEIRSFVEEIAGTFELQVSFEQVSDIELESQHFLLNQLLQTNPALEEVSFISLSGKETARSSPQDPEGVLEGELQDQSLIPKFQKAKTGERYIGPVYFTLRGPMMTIASPVKNKNGVIISVLAGEMNLRELQELVARSRLGESGYLYLVDQDGFLVAHSRFQNLNRVVPGVSAANFYVVNFRSTPFVDRVLKGEAGRGIEGQSRYRNFLNEPVVAAASFLNDFGWGIVAEWPTKDADQIVLTVRNQITSALFFVLLATVALSILLANRIVGPIKILEAGTQRIAEGKFEEPVTIKTDDEIEELGAAFNEMMKGLKRLQELKDEFVFIAAHELRTPVTAIKGYLSMVLEGDAGPVSDTVKEYLQEVIVANQRLIQLVNDLLQVARSEAGRLTVEVKPIDLVAEVKTVLSELKPLADEKTITLTYEPPSLSRVLADSTRYKEVMINLVGNAIKYTVGKGTVIVSHEIKGKELITHVKDTGIGISKDARGKLFEKFYRVQTEQTKNITGTGLGLFIVKQIVEKMNGRIWVESEEGKGSTFSFSLPLA